MIKRWFTFGMYTQFAQGNRVDWDKVIEDIKASKFSGLSLHIISPWSQDFSNPFFPWPWDGTKFLMNKRNGLWWDLLHAVIRKFVRAGLDLQICLFDRYFETGKSWSKYIKVHPFRNNNIGVKFTREHELFNSLANVSSPPFVWIEWKDKTTAQAGDWKPVGKMGPILFEYVQGVLDVIREVRDEFPIRGRICLKVFNEQISGHTDRHEIIQWVQHEAKSRNLLPSPKFFWTYDISIRESDPDEYKRHFKGGYTGSPKAFVKAAKTEVHGVGEQYGYQDYLDWGADKTKMLFSTDGVPAGLNQKAIEELWKSDMPFCDAKSEEGDLKDVISGKVNWLKLKDPMKKWNLSFPHHAGYLK